jgi:hypothetical protein
MNSSLLRLEFLSGFLLSFFPFYKVLLMNRLEFFRFVDHFVKMFKTRVEHGFSIKSAIIEGTVNSMVQKKDSCLL